MTDDAPGRPTDVSDAEVVADDLAEGLGPSTAAPAEQAGPGPAEAGGDITLDEAVRQRDEYLDALRRTQADFENFRKRSLKQASDAAERATGRMAEDLLPVLDACDAAVLHGVEEVEAVVSALVGVLERSGLARIEPSGEPFDPTAHDAVMHEPADDPAAGPTVVEVLRPGYAWQGRVIRPAMVKVRG